MNFKEHELEMKFIVLTYKFKSESHPDPFGEGPGVRLC